jgi:hypothetical protein
MTNTAPVGQFAGQDFYGTQHYAAAFTFERMGDALGNLFITFESLYILRTHLSLIYVRIGVSRTVPNTDVLALG